MNSVQSSHGKSVVLNGVDNFNSSMVIRVVRRADYLSPNQYGAGPPTSKWYIDVYGHQWTVPGGYKIANSSDAVVIAVGGIELVRVLVEGQCAVPLVH